MNCASTSPAQKIPARRDSDCTVSSSQSIEDEPKKVDEEDDIVKLVSACCSALPPYFAHLSKRSYQNEAQLVPTYSEISLSRNLCPLQQTQEQFMPDSPPLTAEQHTSDCAFQSEEATDVEDSATSHERLYDAMEEP